MKKLFPLFLLLILTGAGCAGGTATVTKKSDGGVLKTSDAGKTWISASVVPTAKGIGTLTTANIVNMVMDPQDSSTLYVGTREDGFLLSNDAGASWQQPRYKDLSTGLIADIQIDPKNVCTVYIAKGSHLYKTTDCTRSFQSDLYAEARPNVTITRIAIDWFNPQTIWLGLSNGDLLKSMDGGNSWSTSINVKDAISKLLISAVDSRTILVATATRGMEKTSDGGATWVDLSSSFQGMAGAKTVYDLKQTTTANLVVAATQFGLIRSTDFGSTWSPIKLVTSPGQVIIRAVGIDASNGDQLYYATASTFYRSSDAGATWQTGKLPSARVPRTIIVDPKDNTVLYVGVATEVK